MENLKKSKYTLKRNKKNEEINHLVNKGFKGN